MARWAWGVDVRRVEPELPWGLPSYIGRPGKHSRNPTLLGTASQYPPTLSHPLMIWLAQQQPVASIVTGPQRDSEALASSEHASKLGVLFLSRTQAPGNTLPFAPPSHRYYQAWPDLTASPTVLSSVQPLLEVFSFFQKQMSIGSTLVSP